MSEPVQAWPEYRVTWLTDPNSPDWLQFTPNPDFHGTMGINNKGQVCYGYVPDGESLVRAWVWVPEEDYNLDAGWNNIGEIEDLPLPNIARDINESGWVAGQSGGITLVNFNPAGKATYWMLFDAEDPFEIFDPFDTGWSGAHAINDESPPVMVGDSTIRLPCDCGQHQTELLDHTAFRVVLDGQASPVRLAPEGGECYSRAFDIHTPSSSSARAVGESHWTEAVNPCAGPLEDGPYACGHISPTLDPVNWLGTSLAVMDRINANELGTAARGISDNQEIVGWGWREELQAPECFQSATYWSSPSADATDLGLILPTGHDPEEQQSVAYAVNNLELPWAVGSNIDLGHGIVWKKYDTGDDDWDAEDLNDLIGCTNWTILQAHDINDSNWIVVIADQDEVGVCAVLLTPLGPCPADVNDDGCVDVQDLNQVISDWGACPPSVICYADTDGNCAVDVVDLLAVNNAWCADPCDDPVPQCCIACEQCQESLLGGSGPAGPLTIAELIELVAEADISAQTQAEIIQALMNL